MQCLAQARRPLRRRLQDTNRLILKFRNEPRTTNSPRQAQEVLGIEIGPVFIALTRKKARGKSSLKVFTETEYKATGVKSTSILTETEGLPNVPSTTLCVHKHITE
jgi:hypothetical protein